MSSTHESTEVYKYIVHLEKYLKGDLEQFHKICKEVEKEEGSSGTVSGTLGGHSTSGPGSSPITSSLSPTTSMTSSTTTETTRYPYGTSGTSPVVPKTYFRSTIPHTLTLFSTVDVLGYLLGSNDNPLSTKDNFQVFFRSIFSIDEITVLNTIFRQGLVHVYFPKLDVGISYHSSQPIDKIFFKKLSGEIVLNVNCLEHEVLKKIDTIKGSSSLYVEMERKYNLMVTLYEGQSRGLLSRLVV